jgi:hypothetical protein
MNQRHFTRLRMPFAVCRQKLCVKNLTSLLGDVFLLQNTNVA